MSAILGTYSNGHIILDENADWPDGCRVVVEPAREETTLGIREEDWPETPEGIAAWLKWYDTLEPLIMSPKEIAEWEAARQAQKEFEKAKFEERAQRIEELFE